MGTGSCCRDQHNMCVLVGTLLTVHSAVHCSTHARLSLQLQLMCMQSGANPEHGSSVCVSAAFYRRWPQATAEQYGQDWRLLYRCVLGSLSTHCPAVKGSAMCCLVCWHCC